MNFNKRLTNVLTAGAVLSTAYFGFTFYMEGLNWYGVRFSGWLEYQREFGKTDPMEKPTFDTYYYIKSGLFMWGVSLVPALISTATIGFLTGAGFKVWHK